MWRKVLKNNKHLQNKSNLTEFITLKFCFRYLFFPFKKYLFPFFYKNKSYL